MALDEEISGLYAGPLDAFTPARDALAKRLRKDGDKESAERVKKLRKPSITAWALNRVRFLDDTPISALLEAGERLREAQDQQLRGTGSGDALRAAAEEQRRLVDTIVAAGLEELACAGHAATPALQSRLFATLRAVAADDQAREALAAGMLTRDYEAADFGFGLAGDFELPDLPPPRKREPKAQPAPPQPEPSPGPDITHVPECCACGEGGLGLRRWTNGEKVYGEVLLDARHGGYSNTAHGGMIAVFLDDVLGTVPQLHGQMAVTGTLQIRYRRPGILGRRYELSAHLVSQEGRRLEIVGEMSGEEGLIAEATGTWVTVDSEHYAEANAAAAEQAAREH